MTARALAYLFVLAAAGFGIFLLVDNLLAWLAGA